MGMFMIIIDLGSPKWFNIDIYGVVVYFLIIIYIIIQNLYLKNNRLIQPSREIGETTLNSINSIKYNKLNNKSSSRGGSLNNLSIRNYSTNSCLNKSGGYDGYVSETISERLNTIIKDLGLNPVYTFENFCLESTRKNLLDKTKGLSGIYMISRLLHRFCGY